jgi:glycosyltransferase involved in cell wall biosynthesis
MACGLPVITSSNAGVADRIHDGKDGFILRHSDDFRELAQIVQRLQQDGTLRKSAGEAAARATELWTWDRNAADIWELLKESFARKATPRSTTP